MPLCLTNGVIIMIMMLIIKNMNLSSNIFIFKDKKHKQIINNLLQKYTFSVAIEKPVECCLAIN